MQLAFTCSKHEALIEKFYKERREHINKNCLMNSKARLCQTVTEKPDDKTSCELALALKELGSLIYSKGGKRNIASALECYQAAITALRDNPLNEGKKLQACYSNACLMLLKLKNYEACIELADDYLASIANHRAPDDLLMLKILNRKCDAIIHLSKQMQMPRDESLLGNHALQLEKTILMMKELSLEKSATNDIIHKANSELQSMQRILVRDEQKNTSKQNNL